MLGLFFTIQGIVYFRNIFVLFEATVEVNKVTCNVSEAVVCSLSGSWWILFFFPAFNPINLFILSGDFFQNITIMIMPQ